MTTNENPGAEQGQPGQVENTHADILSSNASADQQVFAPDSKLGAALSLRGRGLRVFPLAAGTKIPAEGFSPHRATTDPDLIRAWWSPCPVLGWDPDYNIGIATGKGLVVLDEDNKNGKRGKETLAFLEGENSKLPATLVAETPSGGRHYLFMCGEEDLRSSVDGLGNGLDIRGSGNHIAAVGSTLPNGEYRWRDATMVPAPLPAWLRAKLEVRPPKQKVDLDLVGSLDADVDIKRAIDWLENHAPTATKGAGSDFQTYKIACQVRDYGISEAKCLELMADHWNETKSSPPWPIDRLEQKVANAYEYAENRPFAKSAAHTFAAAPPTRALEPKPFLKAIVNPRALLPRRWLVRDLLIRENVTLVVAQPGAGKSTLALLTMLAIAAGRHDILGRDIIDRCPVWYWNNEDPEEELHRRILATMQEHRITDEDLVRDGKPMFYVNTGVQRPLHLAIRGGNNNLIPGDTDEVVAFIKERGIGLFGADPFVGTHQGEENDNKAMDFALGQFRTIAQRADCAAMAVHHTRKPAAGDRTGAAGDPNSARGAGSLIGVARVVLTLEGMKEADAKAYGIKKENVWRYMRLDAGKANMSPGAGDNAPLWFEKVSVKVPEPPPGAEFDPATTPAEEVGALRYRELRLPVVDPVKEDAFPDGRRGQVFSAIERLDARARQQSAAVTTGDAPSIPEKAWRAEFYNDPAIRGLSTGTKERTFGRYRDELVGDGFVESRGDGYFALQKRRTGQPDIAGH